jgi:hypothetical protein
MNLESRKNYFEKLPKRIGGFFKTEIKFPWILSAISGLATVFLIYAYMLWKLGGDVNYGKIFSDFSYNSGFFWVFVIFIILCNLPYFKGIIKDVVKEKIKSITEEIIREHVEEVLKKEITTNPNLGKRIVENYLESKNKEDQEAAYESPENIEPVTSTVNADFEEIIKEEREK